KSGRTTGDEIFIFDSTGVAIEDAVASAAVYEKARTAGIGTYLQFAASYQVDHSREDQSRSSGVSVVDQEVCRSRSGIRFSAARHRLGEDRQRHRVRCSALRARASRRGLFIQFDPETI